jgi:predicted PurR-regulated permease PerM
LNAFILALTIAVTVGIALYLVVAMLRSIQQERRRSGVRRVWANFALSIGFCILFLLSWVGQGVAQWQTYTDQQRDHNLPVEIGDFTSDFLQATLENWQSEFLQLFSFVVMSALFIHHGSAESRDSDDRMERKIDEIHQAVAGGAR